MAFVQRWILLVQRPSHVVISVSPAPTTKGPKALAHSFALFEPRDSIPIRQHETALKPMTQEADSQLTNVSSVDTFWIPTPNIKAYLAEIFWGPDYNVYIRAVEHLIVHNKIHWGPVEEGATVQLTEGTTIYLCKKATDDPLLVWSVDRISYGKSKPHWMIGLCRGVCWVLLILAMLMLMLEAFLQLKIHYGSIKIEGGWGAVGFLRTWVNRALWVPPAFPRIDGPSKST